VHVTVESLGYPLRVRLTGGQRHDITEAVALIDGFSFEYVLADRGYDGQAVIEKIEESGAEPVIPSKKNAKQPRDYDDWRYRERHGVECFINKLKQYRRVFSRFDKLARRYLGFVYVASTLIWLR
jgi:transposase